MRTRPDYARACANAFFPVTGVGHMIPSETTAMTTLFGQVRCYEGAARILNELISNAVDHCLMIGGGRVYVDMAGFEFTVANTSRVPVLDFEDGRQTLIPHVLMTQNVTYSPDAYEAIGSGRYGVGIKLVRSFVDKVSMEVSDGKRTYVYDTELNDEERHFPGCEPDPRLGHQFFRMCVTLSSEAFSIDNKTLKRGLRAFLVARLREYVFYLGAVDRDVSIYYSGRRLSCDVPDCLANANAIRDLPVAYVDSRGLRREGRVWAYFAPELESEAVGALVNGVRVTRIVLARKLLRAIAASCEAFRDCRVFVILECPGIEFSGPDKTAVAGRFELHRSRLDEALAQLLPPQEQTAETEPEAPPPALPGGSSPFYRFAGLARRAAALLLELIFLDP
ncbi:GyrB-like ATPase domain protein [Nile crocodilepox virus]|uniref:GyrB-like ATPase domain protein n=1 Tax=Nile crocodilepox virus (isolate Crocodylus niloticus/Zimbabwe/Ume/2001) TaxID=1289473 RepID=Q070G5_CPRVZ|nr:GyrB-like ATPase domain protein [Nile crocodilepox virus]ABJ08977.1 GyrB-like ATPase domain protein [Nile crocodilepox virus]